MSTWERCRDEMARATLYGLAAIVTFVIVLRELERRTG